MKAADSKYKKMGTASPPYGGFYNWNIICNLDKNIIDNITKII